MTKLYLLCISPIYFLFSLAYNFFYWTCRVLVVGNLWAQISKSKYQSIWHLVICELPPYHLSIKIMMMLIFGFLKSLKEVVLSHWIANIHDSNCSDYLFQPISMPHYGLICVQKHHRHARIFNKRSKTMHLKTR